MSADDIQTLAAPVHAGEPTDSEATTSVRRSEIPEEGAGAADAAKAPDDTEDPDAPEITPAAEDPSGPAETPTTEDPGGRDKATAADHSLTGSAPSPDGRGAPVAASSDGGRTAATAEPGQDRTDAWTKLVADPGHAPELLALAAVQSIGPRAQEWVARNHVAYPTADGAALARLAMRQFTRAGSLGSVFGAVAGSYAPIVLLGTAAIAHAELILHLAGAYGLDPADPDRAVDLLVLTRVHPDRGGAEAALAAARRPPYDDGGLSGAAWRLGRMIAAQAGEWGLIRLANRFFPGVGLLAAFLTSRAAAESMAARANTYYCEISRGGPRPAETEGLG